MRGKIVSTVGGVYTIYSDGITYNVIAKGVFRFRNQSVLVGDNVDFDDEECVIYNVDSRVNELIRPRVANLDQLIIVMSLKQPEFSKELLYKFVTYANYNKVKSKVVLTKYDLVENKQEITDICNELTFLGIDHFLISKKTEDHGEINKLIEDLDGKVTIFMGQTGVGKSSLINLIDASFNRGIGEYSEALGRGKHQTKEVILLPYKNGYIGDTPGFSSLDLTLSKIELAHYFPGFKDLNYEGCYYSDCLHLHEKDCNIINAVNDNKYPRDVYDIYVKLSNNLGLDRRK